MKKLTIQSKGDKLFAQVFPGYKGLQILVSMKRGTVPGVAAIWCDKRQARRLRNGIDAWLEEQL